MAPGHLPEVRGNFADGDAANYGRKRIGWFNGLNSPVALARYRITMITAITITTVRTGSGMG